MFIFEAKSEGLFIDLKLRLSSCLNVFVMSIVRAEFLIRLSFSTDKYAEAS
jgi:hypothetical protein